MLDELEDPKFREELKLWSPSMDLNHPIFARCHERLIPVIVPDPTLQGDLIGRTIRRYDKNGAKVAREQMHKELRGSMLAHPLLLPILRFIDRLLSLFESRLPLECRLTFASFSSGYVGGRSV